MSEYFYNGIKTNCAVAICTHIIGGKWKPRILYYLRKGKKRSGDLKKNIHGITDKMFSISLRELENDGLLTRKVFPEVPPRVEYQLTEVGSSIIPVIEKMADWGENHRIL